MYICICNGHRDSDIRSVAETSGLTCPREIYTYLGKPPRCGRCLETASRVIEEVHGGLQQRSSGHESAVEVSKVA